MNFWKTSPLAWALVSTTLATLPACSASADDDPGDDDSSALSAGGQAALAELTLLLGGDRAELEAYRASGAYVGSTRHGGWFRHDRWEGGLLAGYTFIAGDGSYAFVIDIDPSGSESNVEVAGVELQANGDAATGLAELAQDWGASQVTSSGGGIRPQGGAGAVVSLLKQLPLVLKDVKVADAIATLRPASSLGKEAAEASARATAASQAAAETGAVAVKPATDIATNLTKVVPARGGEVEAVAGATRVSAKPPAFAETVPTVAATWNQRVALLESTRDPNAARASFFKAFPKVPGESYVAVEHDLVKADDIPRFAAYFAQRKGKQVFVHTGILEDTGRAAKAFADASPGAEQVTIAGSREAVDAEGVGVAMSLAKSSRLVVVPGSPKDFVRRVAENYRPASRAEAIDPDLLGNAYVDEVLAANVATEVAVSAELGGIAMTRIARLLQSDRAVIVATSADSGAFLTELRALLANRSDVDALLARVTLLP